MKQAAAIAAMIALACGAVACADPSPGPPIPKVTGTPSPPPSTSSAAPESSKAPAYTTRTYTTAPTLDSHVSVEYPYLTDTALTPVNDTIYASVESFVREHAPDKDATIAATLTMDTKAAVTLLTPRVISFVLFGAGSLSSAAYPWSLFTPITIDLAANRVVPLTGMVALDTGLEAVFFAKATQPTDVLAVNPGSFAEGLAHAKELGWAWDPAVIMGYLTPTGLVLSLSVDHAHGDHVEGQLAYADVEPFATSEPTYWNS